MKLLIRLGIVLFGIVSIAAFSISLFLVRNMYIQGVEQRDLPPRYHFALYLPDNQDSFFTEVIRGAERAAAETGTVISIHSIDPSRHELAMASYTGVDGVVVCPYLDDVTARLQLSQLAEKKIPLVLINHNVPNDHPWPYIGANNFDVGRRMGALAKGAGRGAVRLAVVYSDKAPGMLAERELVEMGISAALAGRIADPIAGLRTGLNPLDAEEMIYSLFKTGSPINTLVFTDTIDTIAAAQALIDMNLVGRVQIIGFGDDKGILEYIRKGIIVGSVVVNPEKIGYEAIKSLTELRDTGYTSTAVDAGVELIDRSRL